MRSEEVDVARSTAGRPHEAQQAGPTETGTGEDPTRGRWLLVGAALLLQFPQASNAVLFFILASVIYLCYGGGFGTMPATAGDYFGVKHTRAIYGLMLIGWSLGGILGPILASTLIGDDLAYTAAYTTIGVITLIVVALTFITKLPADRNRTSATADAGA